MGKDPSPLQELQEPRVRSLEREDALEKEMATHTTILGESLKIPMDRGAWWAPAHGVAKELDTT